ncbi:hypothetical protein DUI87_10186 [Hirundo rustica rustica]|uniref:Uncharacterized protein n=1 Tax=Hirundo rustica rustica TaxID=333673 RepID=A0A3M0KHH4_HIRRU|nr:hypothetical protein DUI87_10186 [Hirundo rustica rustica]
MEQDTASTGGREPEPGFSLVAFQCFKELELPKKFEKSLPGVKYKRAVGSSQDSSTCSEIPQGMDRDLYRQEKRSGDPQKLRKPEPIDMQETILRKSSHIRTDAATSVRQKFTAKV